jgi:hypothetical protein
MADCISAWPVSSSFVFQYNEALDRALIQCLRLFAQNGRKVRNKKPPADEISLAGVLVKKELESSNNNEILKTMWNLVTLDRHSINTLWTKSRHV